MGFGVPASVPVRQHPGDNQKDFEKHNRKKFCARIATGDYDAIIMGHSQFEKIPISKERQERLLHEQIWEITEGISEVEASGGERSRSNSWNAKEKNPWRRGWKSCKPKSQGRCGDV